MSVSEIKESIKFMSSEQRHEVLQYIVRFDKRSELSISKSDALELKNRIAEINEDRSVLVDGVKGLANIAKKYKIKM